MIRGCVTENGEIRLAVEVKFVDGAFRALEFMLDTGFSDALALPSEALAACQTFQEAETEVFLADGSMASLQVRLVEVRWHGRVERVPAYELPTALLGMNMLHGSRVCFDVTAGGAAEITPLEVL